MPAFRWRDLIRSLIEHTEQMKTVAHFPSIVIERFKSQGLLGQHLRDVDPFTAPLDLSVVAHLSYCNLRTILDRWQFDWIGSWRSAIHTAWGLSSQSLMGALPVVLLSIRIIGALLSWTIGLWQHGFFKGSMHALMATFCAGLPGRIRSGLIPSRIHHFDNSLIPPTASEANGTPLSVRIA